MRFIAYTGTQVDAPLVGGQDVVSSRTLDVLWAGSTLAMAQQFQDGEVRKLSIVLENPLLLDEDLREKNHGKKSHAAIVDSVGKSVACGHAHWDGVVFLDTADGMEVADVVAVFSKNGKVDHAVTPMGFTRYHEVEEEWRSTPGFFDGQHGEQSPSRQMEKTFFSEPDAWVDEKLLAVGMACTKAAPIRMRCDVENDQQGVVVGALTSINRSLQSGQYTTHDMAQHWADVRDLLKERHGDTVVLYRADAPQEKWHEDTQVVYMGDHALAEKFANRGRKVDAFLVPVNDVLALNVQPNGYWEFVVKKQAPTPEKSPVLARAEEALREIDRLQSRKASP